jgi:hypothetical protein
MAHVIFSRTCDSCDYYVQHFTLTLQTIMCVLVGLLTHTDRSYLLFSLSSTHVDS